MNSTVSVVIPTYKNRGGLKQCIYSVLKQDYQGPIEIIVVDDNDPGSLYRSETEDQMKEFYGEKKIIYIKHIENKNGAAARNTGIKAASGDYISFLDDDDIFLANKISMQVDFLNKHKEFQAVYCFEKIENISNINNTVFKGDSSRAILQGLSNFQTSTLMLRKDSLLALNGFDEDFIRHQDIELMLRFFQKGFVLGCVPEVLVKMGRNDGSNIPTGKKLEDLKTFFFDKFDKNLIVEDQKTPGFSNKVYARHYASVFLSHIKYHHPILACKVLFRFMPKSPSVFFSVIYNSLKAHVTGQA